MDPHQRKSAFPRFTLAVIQAQDSNEYGEGQNPKGLKNPKERRSVIGYVIGSKFFCEELGHVFVLCSSSLLVFADSVHDGQRSKSSPPETCTPNPNQTT